MGSLDGLDDERMGVVYVVDAVLPSQGEYRPRCSYCEVGRCHPENIASLICAAHHIFMDQSLRVLAPKFVHDTLTSPGIGGFRCLQRTPGTLKILIKQYRCEIY